MHREMGVAAARAGKPFWIEKPVGRNAGETADIAAAVRAAGLETSIGYNYRGAPAVERMRDLVSSGELGRVTNVRGVFFNSYTSEPNGALSWRFKREYAGAGALGDLLSHVVDLVQYVVGPVQEVLSQLATFYHQRPVLPMGTGTHFAVIEGGEMAPVENDDYAGALVRFAPGAYTEGAVGTLEASRIVVGPQCGLAIEVYGTEGSATWNFEQMNELQLCLGRGGPNAGYTRVLANDVMGEYGRFQPGPANAMGYDDLKVVEGKKFLVALTGGDRRNSTIYDALSDAEVLAAAAASAEDGRWHRVPEVPGATFGKPGGGGRAHDREARPGGRPSVPGPPEGLATVVALGTVDPALVSGPLRGQAVFVAEPEPEDLRRAAGAIVRADVVVDEALLDRMPNLRVVARTGVGVDLVDVAAATRPRHRRRYHSRQRHRGCGRGCDGYGPAPRQAAGRR